MSVVAGQPLLPLSIVDSVYSSIKDEILSGHYPPGAPLRQDDIANRYGVSRIPLREAFSRLEAEGLLTLRPRRGYAVPSLDADEIREIFDLRAVVEEHAGRIAAAQRTKEDSQAVTELAAKLSMIDLGASGAFNEWCRLNREFHMRIIASCRRRHLIKMALQLRDVVEPYIRLETTMTGADDQANIEHAEIVAAFVAGDAERTGALSAQHCFHTRDRLLELLARKLQSG